MNIKVIDELASKEVQESPDVKQQPGEMSPPMDLAKMEVINMLGLKDGEESESVDTLLKWAKANTDDHSPEGLKWAIRNLEAKTGTPPLGEKVVTFLSRYAYLNLESLRINKELENYKPKL